MAIELDISTTSKSKFDVLIVGDQGVGKSTLLYKYMTGIFCEELPSEECVRVKTITDQPYGKCELVTGEYGAKRETISILDSSASLSSFLTDHAFLILNARTILFTYSIDSLKSFEDLEYTMSCIRSLTKTPLPCAIAALKMDLIDYQQVSFEQGMALAEQFNALAFNEVSSKIDATVDIVFKSLVDFLHQLRVASKEPPIQKVNRKGSVSAEKDADILRDINASKPDNSFCEKAESVKERSNSLVSQKQGQVEPNNKDTKNAGKREGFQQHKKSKSFFSFISCFST